MNNKKRKKNVNSENADESENRSVFVKRKLNDDDNDSHYNLAVSVLKHSNDEVTN